MKFKATIKEARLRLLTLIIILIGCITQSHTYAQNNIKGVTKSGKEENVWGSYQNNVWKALPFVNEYGSMVPWPRLARNGKLLKYAPLVKTDSVYNIMSTTADVAGTIWHNGWCAPINVRGVQIASDEKFTQDTVRIKQMSPSFSAYDVCMPPCALNAYSSHLTNLLPGRTYYARAYARNNCGENFGDTLSFTTTSGFQVVVDQTSPLIICDVQSMDVTYIAKKSFDAVCSYEWTVINSNGNTYVTNQDTLVMTYKKTAPECKVICTLRSSDTVMKDSVIMNVTKDNVISYELCTDNTNGYIKLKSPYNIQSVIWTNSKEEVVGTSYTLTDIPDGTYYLECISPLGCHHIDSATVISSPTFCNVSQVRTLDELSLNGDDTKVSSVKDHQGNKYDVAQIGSHCWMKQNMRCTTSPRQGTGTGQVNLQQGSSTDGSTPYYYNNTESAMDIMQRGLLYNWAAALDTSFVGGTQPDNIDFINRRGICPDGWHLPTNAEYEALMEATHTSSSDGSGLGQLSAGCSWITSEKETAPGNSSYLDRNKSGFSALSCGTYEGAFTHEGEGAYMWSASSDNSSNSMSFNILADYEYATPGTYNKGNGLSVRCIRSEYALTETSIDTVTCTSLKVSAQLAGFSNAMVKTVYAYTDAACTQNKISASTIRINDELNTLDALFTGLSCNTRYYIKIMVEEGSACHLESVVSDSTRDVTIIGQTFCSVLNYNKLQPGTDKSAEHLKNGNVNEIDSVYDYEGNAYAVVTIGQQCWMKENLRCKTGPNGSITQGTLDSPNANNPRYYDYTSCVVPARERGLLYNWPAALDTNFTSPFNAEYVEHRGICPAGWHLPTDDEWATMAANAGVVGTSNDNGSGLGKLTSSCYWTEYTSSDRPSAPGYYLYPERGISHFSALPAGIYSGSTLKESGSYAYFWTATGGNDVANEKAIARTIYYSRLFLHRNNSCSKSDAYSIRCIRDNEYGVLPMVDSVTCTSMWISAKALTFTALSNETVCAYTDKGCTNMANCASDVRVNDTQDSVFATISGLNCNTRYFIKVTLSDGIHSATTVTTDSTRDLTVNTATSCTVPFKLKNENEISKGVIDSVYDHENNAYAVVQVGNQCWLKQNMRCVSSPKKRLSEGEMSKNEPLSPKYYNYTGCTIPLLQRGYLYNWAGALDTTFAVNSNASFLYRRGICPEGWHLPSEAEWLTMFAETGVDVSASAGTGAGKLTSGCDWLTDGAVTSPSDFNYSERNSIGMSIVPAGLYYNNSSCEEAYNGALLWSSTSSNESNAIRYRIRYNNGYVQPDNMNKGYAFSVRCVRDAFIPVIDVCEDLTFGKLTLSESEYIQSLEISNESGNVVEVQNTPAAGTEYTTLPEGQYTFTAVSSTGDTAFATATMKHEHTYCFTLAKNGVEIDDGKWANHEWSSTTNHLDSVSDIEGNVYKVIQIGQQCWMKENSRCKKDSTGNNISYYDYTSSKVPLQQRGYLYNWQNAINTCPKGWHLPSEADWDLMMEKSGADKDAAKGLGKLVTSCYWNNSSNETAPGNYDYLQRNSSGFSAVPGGFYDGSYQNSGAVENFWSATEANTGNAWNRTLDYSSEYIAKNATSKSNAYAVRCVRYSVLPEIDFCEDDNFGRARTFELVNTSKMEVYNDKNVLILTDNKPESGDYYSNIPDGIYRFVAYSVTGDTTSVMVSFKHNFTTCQGTAHTGTLLANGKWANHEWSSAPNQIDSISDHEGNVYEIVQIGSQCWLKQNMRCITSPTDGDNVMVYPVPLNNTWQENVDYSYDYPKTYYWNNDKSEDVVYRNGILYNHAAALNHKPGQPYLQKGICPNGWHIPDMQDINTLLASAGIGSIPLIGNMGESSSKGEIYKLCGTCDWKVTTSPAGNPGDYTSNPEARNSTGFSVTPTGQFYGSKFQLNNNYAYFWCYEMYLDSKIDMVNGFASYLQFSIYNAEVAMCTDLRAADDSKLYGRSVRCVRDSE